MDTKLRFQLSTMMFIQYFIWGTWYVSLTIYLSDGLGFTGTQIGLCYGTFAISAVISPFFVGLIADKYFATEKVLASMHILGAILFVVAAQAKSFAFFYPALLLYALSYTPTMALSSSISFHQMEDPSKQFPSIRVLGTIGWIAANLVITSLEYENSVNQLYVGAIASLLLGFYCFTLPHTPPKKEAKASWKELLGLDAIGLLKERSFMIIIIASVLIFIPLSFYYAFTGLFMSDIGMTRIAGKLSFGQMAEILFMLILPFFLRKYGVKKVLIIGMAAWLTRYILFSYGNTDSLVWMIYIGILLHGICYDFFFVAGQIYVAQKAPNHLKSSAQGIFTLATYGLGMIIGTWFAGITVDFYTTDSVTNWPSTWLVPAGIAAIVLILFMFIFKEKNNKKEEAT